jgi:hypothetical protein
LKRYHSDCYRFEEYDPENKPYQIKASIRTKKDVVFNFETPERQYYHPRTRLPVEDGHHDRDCDDESTDGWFEVYREERVNDFADLPEKAKRFFNLWNTFILKSKIGQQHHLIPGQIIKFVQRHAEDLVDLDMMYFRFLTISWLRRLITSDQVKKLMALYTSETERFLSAATKTKMESETTSNPADSATRSVSQTTTKRNDESVPTSDCMNCPNSSSLKAPPEEDVKHPPSASAPTNTTTATTTLSAVLPKLQVRLPPRLRTYIQSTMSANYLRSKLADRKQEASPSATASADTHPPSHDLKKPASKHQQKDKDNLQTKNLARPFTLKAFLKNNFPPPAVAAAASFTAIGSSAPLKSEDHDKKRKKSTSPPPPTASAMNSPYSMPVLLTKRAKKSHPNLLHETPLPDQISSTNVAESSFEMKPSLGYKLDDPSCSLGAAGGVMIPDSHYSSSLPGHAGAVIKKHLPPGNYKRNGPTHSSSHDGASTASSSNKKKKSHPASPAKQTNNVSPLAALGSLNNPIFLDDSSGDEAEEDKNCKPAHTPLAAYATATAQPASTATANKNTSNNQNYGSPSDPILLDDSDDDDAITTITRTTTMQCAQTFASQRLNNVLQTQNSFRYLAQDGDNHSGEYYNSEGELCRGRCQRRNVEKQENHHGETHKR